VTGDAKGDVGRPTAGGARGGKGQLTAEVGLFHPLAQTFLIADAIAPQSRVSSLMHDRASNDLQGRRVGDNETLIEDA